MIQSIKNITKFVIPILPLQFDIHDSKIILKDETAEFCNITNMHINTIEKTNKIFYNLVFSSSYNIVSPALLQNKKKYTFNYSLLPIKKSNHTHSPYLIVYTKSKYLLFTFDINQDIEITNDFTNKTIAISFQQNYFPKITIQLFDTESEVYLTILKQQKMSLNPPWANGLGIVIDFNKTADSEIVFSKINEVFSNKLSADSIFFIFKNWEASNTLFTENKHKINDLESLINRCLINNNRFIFHYDNTIPNSSVKDYPILKLRSGKIPEELNRQYIDFFNERGKQKILSLYETLLDYKAVGIYISPTIPQLENTETYSTILCKTNNEYFQFRSKIKNGLERIDDIITEVSTENLLFFCDVLSPEISSANYLLQTTTNVDEIFMQIEDFYKQGYNKFALEFQENISLSVIQKKISLLFLISPILILDFTIISDIIRAGDDINQFINNLLDIRSSLRIFHDNTIISFKETGILPFKLIINQNKVSGCILNNCVYFAIIKERIFDSVITIPKGKWYSLFSNKIIEGGADYIHKKNNTRHHIFLKVNSILPYITTSDSLSSLQPEKITFYMYINSSFKKNITERYTNGTKIIFIEHNFKFTSKQNELICEYSSNNKIDKGRFFNFHFVVKNKIKNILLNNKKCFFTIADNNFVEILVQNKSKNITIKIKYDESNN